MVRIRLARLGAKKRPYYRMVAIDGRDRRDGRPLEYLGTYNPVAKDKALDLDLEKIDAWIAKGARPSETAAALVKRARKAAADAPAATEASS